MTSSLHSQDFTVYDAIAHERDRQVHKLEMIASENFVSPAVMEAQGSVMTNKYAEGYPHKRYYGGCEYVDVVESLAIDRAKQLFGAEFINVQPHSGSQANMAVYMTVCNPGDTVLGMALSEGGHLTHGAKVNFSGKLYNAVSYGLNPKTERIDYDRVETLAKAHKPKLIVVGASAYPRDIDFAAFRAIADQVGAKVLADIAHPAGLVATGLHGNPVPYCEFVTTTTHKTLRGPRGGMIMCREEFGKAINSAIFPGIQGGPLMHVIAAKAVAFGEDLQPAYKAYCQQIIANCQALARVFTDAGYRLVSGGTDNHLILIDLTDKGVSGKAAEDALGQAGITVNKNTVPNETRSPFVTSGIRVGTAALTTRGMAVPEMTRIAGWMTEVLSDIGNTDRQARIKSEIREFCRNFPLYA